MKKLALIFIMFIMFVSCATLPHIGFCVKQTCIITTDTGAKVLHDGKEYACNFELTPEQTPFIKIDFDLFESAGEMYVIVDGKKIGCSIQ
jgi:hypothetical protein